LLITDKTIVNLPSVAPLLQSFKQSFSSVIVFDDFVPEPPIETAEAAIEVGLASRADGIVALGGGSNLDIGKIAATVLMHGGAPRVYFGFDAVRGKCVSNQAIDGCESALPERTGFGWNPGKRFLGKLLPHPNPKRERGMQSAPRLRFGL